MRWNHLVRLRNNRFWYPEPTGCGDVGTFSYPMSRKKLFIAGHRGMVGGALVRRFQDDARWQILTVDREEVDLTRQDETEKFLAAERPDAVIVAAARVGGIHANSAYPAEFIHQNLAIADHTIHGAWLAGVKRLLFLGSSCIYPKLAAQPMTEEALLGGALEPSNEAYAIAKIAGLKLCQHYRQQYGVMYHSAMPTNLYGAGDNYHAENSHVIPGMIRRFHEAKQAGAEQVAIWGTGTPRREFLHVDDLAAACEVLLCTEQPPDLVNVGSGKELTILDLARLVAKAVGFEGEIVTDLQRPDGTPRKLLDISKMQALGWQPKIGLADGLRRAYQDFEKAIRSGEVRGSK